MPPIFSFHHDRRHRQRQLKWVLPLVGILGAGTILTLAVQYWLSDQAVGDEFFRAHKTITHTGEMLARSYLMGGVVLLGLRAVALLAYVVLALAEPFIGVLVSS